MWVPETCHGLVLCISHSGTGYMGRGSLFEVEVRGVEQDLIPYVGQLVLANVPIERWIIDPYEHGLLDDPGNGM